MIPLLNISTFKRNGTPANLADAESSGSAHTGRFERTKYPGLTTVLEEIKKLITQAKGDPAIRQKAVDITENIAKDARTNLPNRRDFDAIADAIYDYTNENIAYVRDPNDIEFIQSAQKTLKREFGDCDDHVILNAALLETLGIPTRLKVVATNRKKPRSFSHIFLEYKNQKGQWKKFDTTLHSKAGLGVPDRSIFREKTVTLDDFNPNIMKNIQLTPLSDCNCQSKAEPELSGFLDKVKNFTNNVSGKIDQFKEAKEGASFNSGGGGGSAKQNQPQDTGLSTGAMVTIGALGITGAVLLFNRSK